MTALRNAGATLVIAMTRTDQPSLGCMLSEAFGRAVDLHQRLSRSGFDCAHYEPALA